jgi:hypothetical protein
MRAQVSQPDQIAATRELFSLSLADDLKGIDRHFLAFHRTISSRPDRKWTLSLADLAL